MAEIIKKLRGKVFYSSLHLTGVSAGGSNAVLDIEKDTGVMLMFKKLQAPFNMPNVLTRIKRDGLEKLRIVNKDHAVPPGMLFEIYTTKPESRKLLEDLTEEYLDAQLQKFNDLKFNLRKPKIKKEKTK